MRNSKSYPKVIVVLLMALLPAALLTGCHGDLGWDRMVSPTGR